MKRTCIFIGAALAMLFALPIMAQHAKDVEKAKESDKTRTGVIEVQSGPVQIQVAPQAPAARIQVAQPIEPARQAVKAAATGSTATNPNEWSTYWLGIQIVPVPMALRSHLNLPEKQGLLVAALVKGGPAERAGFARYDVLLRAGDKKLCNSRDLLAAVEAAKETKLPMELIRAGKPRTIEVTPAKRPEPTFVGSETSSDADWEAVQRWMESMTPGQDNDGNRAPVRFQIVNPGAIVPQNAFSAKPLPANMSIAISKTGDQPARIDVKRGDDKWSLTEKDLDKLPADVRAHVERMLGRTTLSGSLNIVPRGAMPNQPMQPQAVPTPDELQRHIQKQIEEMNRRMEEMHKMIERQQRGLDSDSPKAEEPKAQKEPMLEKKGAK